MQFQFKAPKGLVIWVMFGILGGLLVAGGFYFHWLTPAQTRFWFNVGGAFWVITGAIVWALRAKIELGFYDQKFVRPELSGQQWKAAQDAEQGWRPHKY